MRTLSGRCTYISTQGSGGTYGDRSNIVTLRYSKLVPALYVCRRSCPFMQRNAYSQMIQVTPRFWYDRLTMYIAALLRQIYFRDSRSLRFQGPPGQANTWGRSKKNPDQWGRCGRGWCSKKFAKRHSTEPIRWSSPTQLLRFRCKAYLWVIEREPEYSLLYDRMRRNNVNAKYM